MTLLPERGWEQPELTGWGRLETRSPLIPYPDAEAALHEDREQSPCFENLNGRWSFELVSHPDAADS